MTTMSGSQGGMPALFVNGKRNAAMIATDMKYISKRMKYCSRSNFWGNNTLIVASSFFPGQPVSKAVSVPLRDRMPLC